MNQQDEYSPMSPGKEANLLALKRARKQIEADAQLLANRIALLKQEELKSWKKIEETKKKAREVYLLKKKNEDKQAEKELKAAKSHSNLKNNQQASTDFRRQKEKEKQDKLESIYMQKHQGMMSIKKQSQTNDQKKQDIINKHIQTNQSKSQKVKEQEQLCLLKKKELEASKLMQARLHYEKRMADEEGLKRKKEAEVLNMEKLEMELIKRLQQTQTLQKTAYEELENALSQPPEEYAKRYFKSDSYNNNSEGGSPVKSNKNDDDGYGDEQGSDNKEEEEEQNKEEEQEDHKDDGEKDGEEDNEIKEDN